MGSSSLLSERLLPVLLRAGRGRERDWEERVGVLLDSGGLSLGEEEGK